MTATLSLPIQNMTCGGCAARVGRLLEAVDGVTDVNVNFAAAQAEVTFDDTAKLESAVTALAEAGYPAEDTTVQLQVTGMSCASCAGRLSEAFNKAPGVLEATVNLASDTASVRYIPSVLSAAKLAQLATDTGYPAQVSSGHRETRAGTDHSAAAETLRSQVLMSAALTLPVFVLEMGGHLFPDFHHFIARTIGLTNSWILQFLLTTAVLVGPGRQFFRTGLPALWNRRPTMNSLVALGAGAAWVFSSVALWLPAILPQGTRAVYFEAAAVIVTLILLGKWFEARAKGRTGSAIQKLLDLTPPTARVWRDSDWIDEQVSTLKVGDRIMIQPGSKVPVDAEVVEGKSAVDESMLTGEAMPVAKQPKDSVTGGSVNGAGSLICTVTRTGDDTTLAEIIRLVQNAQGARLPIQALVDRITLWFVPAVLVIALITVLVWIFVGPEPRLSFALVAGVSVLIIACPCAMGLATPTSIMVGSGRAAELGVLFRQGDALQSLGKVAVVAFDKTGTLTEGAPAVTVVECADGPQYDTTLAKIAAVESHSEHPLGSAVVTYAKSRDLTLPQVSRVSATAGHGISGDVEGSKVIIGNAALMTELGIDHSDFAGRADMLRQQGQTVFFAAEDDRAVALIAVSDPLRLNSQETVKSLQAAGLQIAMITGDAEKTARAVANKLGIEHVQAEVMPSEKRDALLELRNRYGAVAFVGDGINDAPVLAAADVGVAIGTGTDIAIEAADVVLMSGDVQGVARAIELSRKTLSNIKQNLVWAFGYNVVLIPVAAGVLYPVFGLLLSPGLAAGAMAFSSVFVLGNALRLRNAGTSQ